MKKNENELSMENFELLELFEVEELEQRLEFKECYWFGSSEETGGYIRYCEW